MYSVRRDVFNENSRTVKVITRTPHCECNLARYISLRRSNGGFITPSNLQGEGVLTISAHRRWIGATIFISSRSFDVLATDSSIDRECSDSAIDITCTYNMRAHAS